MSHDGTIHSSDSRETTPRDVVYLYKSNVNIPATTKDVYLVGTVLLNDIDRVEDLVTEVGDEVTELTEVTEKEFKTVEQRLLETEEILAEVIFVLENTGIEVSENMINYRNEHLNL